MSDARIVYNILVAIKGLAETGLMYLQESGNVPTDEPAKGHEGDPVRKVQDASGNRAVKTFGRKEYPLGANLPEE
jgi:hypothetical protein